MTERQYDQNIFLLPKGPAEAAVVTTNGICRANGRLVMGAGIAKYCRDTHMNIDLILGRMVAANGNAAYYAGSFQDRNRKNNGIDPVVNVLSMPTKNDWRNASDPELIRKSCRELSALATKHGFSCIYLPAPGCANGGLDYKTQVRSILKEELDDRFVVCLPTHIYRTL